MTLITVLFISIGLAMDAFAVSIGLGIKAKDNKMRVAVKAAFLFGVFQSLMPVIGWFAGNQFKDLLKNYSPWVTFIILILIGIKMIYESTKMDKKCDPSGNADKFITLLILAIATSIDALAVGVSFSFMNIAITIPVIIIGLVAFIFSFIGVEIGNRLGCYAKSRAEIFGGLILILLGIKTLLEHLYFA